MDRMELQPIPVASVNQNLTSSGSEQPRKNLLSRIKNLTRKQKILAGLAGIVLVAVVILLVLRNTGDSSTPQIIAKIGDKNVYGSYLNREMELYPAPKNEKTKELLTQKIIDDQIVLSAGKAEGMIDSYPEGEDLSTQEYLGRTQQVAAVKKAVIDKQNSLEGELVSVWFYNAGLIGPKGYEKSKLIAFEKISGLYE